MLVTDNLDAWLEQAPIETLEEIAFCEGSKYPDSIKKYAHSELVRRNDCLEEPDTKGQVSGLRERDRPPSKGAVASGYEDGTKENTKGKRSKGGSERTSKKANSDSEDEERKPSIPKQCFETLFARDRFATIAGTIYHYNGTHYEEVEAGLIEREIIEYLEENHVGDETPGMASSCLSWFKKKTFVSPKQVNSSGINLKNCILDITVDSEGKVIVAKSKHTHERVFTYCSDVNYEPNAERKYLNQLLSALDEPYKNIFVRTLSASLALPEVRRKLGRGIKCLLMTGTGANGKDTCMLPIEFIFGQSITHINSIAMLDYDNGRKFGCFGIVGSVINYATEAKKVDQLAECSFLKALITGDTVEVERKNQQGEYYKPQCIALFSTNEDVNFRNNSEAVKSRYAQIPFTKTFARHPKPGELRADSRFHDDPSFVKENICPAFINLLIEELQNLLDKGIDYTATDADMESDKYNNDRIYCYFTNKGIVHVPGGKASGHYVLLKDAWDVYLEGLEKDGVDEELRRKNNKDYCNDMRRFSSWVKRSYLGIESDQVNLKGQYPTVLWGLAWERDLSTHAHNQGTVSLPEYTPQTHQGTQPHTPNKSECESVCEGVNSVCDSEALSREECVHVCEGKWIALHPDSEHGSDNKASWKLCKVIRPGNNFKTWFWVIFDGETQERKIAASDIEPDPTGEDW